jgi:hypothetical protein
MIFRSAVATTMAASPTSLGLATLPNDAWTIAHQVPGAIARLRCRRLSILLSRTGQCKSTEFAASTTCGRWILTRAAHRRSVDRVRSVATSRHSPRRPQAPRGRTLRVRRSRGANGSDPITGTVNHGRRREDTAEPIQATPGNSWSATGVEQGGRLQSLPHLAAPPTDR